ncbi:MAG: CvpA family protein [Bacteroides fragilis]|nr:CvpA family protein [Bacteroides fragilis]
MNIDFKMVFIFVILLMAAWRIRKGFQNGMIKELVNIFSIAAACVCITLLFLTISSIVAKTFSVLTVCIAGLIGIGIVYKLCSFIFRPITAIVNISVIHGLDKLLGAVMGIGETAICAYFLYRVIDYFGVR